MPTSRFHRLNALAVAAIAAGTTTAAAARADTVTGKVLDAAGKPVAGAIVTVKIPKPGSNSYPPAMLPDTPTMTTDASGTFHFDLAPMDSSLFGMEWNGGATKMYGIATVTAPGLGIEQRILGADNARNTFTLKAAQRIFGTVAGDDGKPIAGFMVHVEWWTEGGRGNENPINGAFLNYGLLKGIDDKISATSDAAGKWEIDGLPPGGAAYLVGQSPKTSVVSMQNVVPQPMNGTAGAVAAGSIKLVAHLSSTVTGIALGPDGKPVSGARVTAYSDEGDGGSEVESVSGADGAFKIMGVAPGKVAVRVYHAQIPAEPAHDTKAVTPPPAAAETPPLVQDGDAVEIAVSAGQTVALPSPMRMTRAIAVEGSVMDAETGAGIAGITLGFNQDGNSEVAVDDENSARARVTDHEGRFHFWLSPGKSVRLFLQTGETGYSDSGDTGHEVKASSAPDASPPAPLVFKLKKGWVFSGTVSGTDGKPLPGLHVRLTPANQGEWDWTNAEMIARLPKSDAAGNWKVLGLERSDQGYQLRIDPEWEIVSPPPATILKPGGEGVLEKSAVEIVVKRRTTRSFYGTVVDTDGAPIPHVRADITAMRKGPNGQSGASRNINVESDEKGQFSMENVALDETVNAGIWAQGYKFRSGGEVKAESGTGPLSAKFVLVKLSGTVKGKVVDAKGKPVPGATVWSTDGGPGAVTTSDSSGAFTLTAIPSGSINISAAKGAVWVGQTTGSEGVIPLTLDTAVPANSAAADAARAREMLAQFVSDKRGEKGIDRSFLTNYLARTDPDAALALAASAHPAGESVPDGVIANLIEARLAVNPEATAKWAATRIPQMAEPMVRVRSSCEIGIELAISDPTAAARWYESVRDDAALPGAAVDINRSRLVALAALLRNSTDEAAHLSKLKTALGTPQKKRSMGARCAAQVARGDVPAAEKLLAEVSPDDRYFFYTELISRTLKTSPISASVYLGRLRDSMASDKNPQNGWYQQQAVALTLKVIAALGPSDPAAALALAKSVPDTDSSYPLALATAARFQTPAVAEPLWAAAVKAGSANPWERPGHLASLAFEASKGPSAAVREKARSLWHDAAEAAADRQYQLGEPAKWAMQAARFDPALARMALERIYADCLNQPAGRVERYEMCHVADAMALIDPARAEALLDAVPPPSAAEREQMAANNEEDYALDGARLNLIRLLMLPPEKRAFVSHDAIWGYGTGGGDIEDGG